MPRLSLVGSIGSTRTGVRQGRGTARSRTSAPTSSTTGIGRNHPDLDVVAHLNFHGGGNSDCSGHGTHVADTMTAKDNTSDVVGVAPDVPLTGVKVLGCDNSGLASDGIKGINWVTANVKKPAMATL